MSAPSATKTDLLILGLLLDRPMHGYELYQQMQAEGISAWFDISMPSVYYSLGKLRDQDWVTETRQRGGRSPRKSIYHLTEEGRAAFFAAMEAQVASEERVYLDYDVAIYLLNKLPFQQVVPLLEQHRAFLEAELQRVQAAAETEQDASSSPLKLAVLDHRRRYLEMERSWLSNLISGIQSEDWRDSGRGLMILSGDLRRYHLPDLLRLVSSGRHGGTLTVTDGTRTRTLSFEGGQPICASCRRSGEQPAEPASVEEVKEGLYDLFRWQEGQFTFNQELGCSDWCVPLSIGTEELILCGCRSVDNWDVIQRLIPSADTVFEPTMDAEELRSLDLAPIEGQILTAVDGVREVTAIARELELTLFEVSRAIYCLAAVGVISTADPDKSLLRRVFREIAELICNSTTALRTSPDDRSCEQEVNQMTGHLPLVLNRGRIEDRADPQLETEGLADMYRGFLRIQLDVVGRRFGEENTRQWYERTLRQLPPELQAVAKRYGLDRLLES